MSMKNDISFLIDSRLSLYEHQSTYNPNMPLRLLHYIADLYESMVNPIKLYGSSPVQIPPPRFIVFCNGIKEKPEREESCLSRLYRKEMSIEEAVERAITECIAEWILEFILPELNLSHGSGGCVGY